MNKTAFALGLGIGAAAGAFVSAAVIWLCKTVHANMRFTMLLWAAGFGFTVLVICEIRRIKAVKGARNACLLDLRNSESNCGLLASWITLRNRGRLLSEYFTDHGHKSVAIYGLDGLGICLFEELRHSTIEVRYGIDQDPKRFSYLDLKVISPEARFETVDIIVVTPFMNYEKLIPEIQGKTSSSVVRLEDIVQSV